MAFQRALGGIYVVLRDLVLNYALQGPWLIFNLGALIALAILLVYIYTTKTGVIARATTKEAIRQPVFLLTIAIVIVISMVNTVLPFFTLGEDVKMLKDCGLATILISGLLIASWTASTSISDEIEGKTAMTLLSKPVNRRQFILGKYLGIVQAVMLYMVPVVIVFLTLIYFKIGYDAREASAAVAPTHAQRLAIVAQILPGLVLVFFEIIVLAAMSVAISTRLPMVVNLTSCFAVFVVGHLTPQLVEAGTVKLEFVEFMARVIATILPALNVFNVSVAISTDKIVPAPYLGLSALYTFCYCAATILLAFILFEEDRDLA